MTSPSQASGQNALAVGADSIRLPSPLPRADAAWTARWPGWIVLWSGWLLPQFLLLGPALVGLKVALPLDLLAAPNCYLPDRPEYKQAVSYEFQMLTDLILDFPPQRQFATQEIRAGRLPIWQPANFAGAPFATWSKYSPFEILHYLAPGPVSVAWGQLLQMLVFATGMWQFLRKSLNLSYWPAAIISWCAPLSGFLVLWQGFPVVGPVCWLPWSLLVVHRAVKHPGGWSGLAVAGVTLLVILSGQSPIAGLVLLTTGLYVVWLLSVALFQERCWRHTAMATAAVTVGWLAGFSLAAPYLAPLLEYTATGARIQERAAGIEERPPEGLASLQALILPDVYGNDRRGSVRIVDSFKLESPSTGYAGLLALFWLAPLAWSHPQYRREAIFFTIMAIVGLGWAANLPGLVQILRIWPLNMLACNRWVFATSSAILILSAIGLDQLLCGSLKYRRWFVVPILVTTGFGLYCLYCSTVALPEPLYSELETALRLAPQRRKTVADLEIAKPGFMRCYGIGGILSLGALGAWIVTVAGDPRRKVWRFAAVGLLPVELFWFAVNERRQGDRALYFPRVAALDQLAALPAGRIWGIRCLPPSLNQFAGLEDIRGYDSVDPANFIRLFELACEPHYEPGPHARTMWVVPLTRIERDLRLHPVADMLNVRYLVLRKPPPDGTTVVVHQDDYWVVENPHVLPRAFVPHTARVRQTDDDALAAMSSYDFDPRGVAFVASDPGVPDSMEGTADIHYETPTRARLDVDMKTDGLVVVSDMWDVGWKAELDGVPSTIHRTNVALRGIRVPAGAHIVQMIYDPQSLRLGFQIAGSAALVLLVWAIYVLRNPPPMIRGTGTAGLDESVPCLAVPVPMRLLGRSDQIRQADLLSPLVVEICRGQPADVGGLQNWPIAVDDRKPGRVPAALFINRGLAKNAFEHEPEPLGGGAGRRVERIAFPFVAPEAEIKGLSHQKIHRFGRRRRSL